MKTKVNGRNKIKNIDTLNVLVERKSQPLKDLLCMLIIDMRVIFSRKLEVGISGGRLGDGDIGFRRFP